MGKYREQAIADVAAAMTSDGACADAYNKAFEYAVAQREVVLELASKVVARGCNCHSTTDDDWHAKSCVIPAARKARHV